MITVRFPTRSINILEKLSDLKDLNVVSRYVVMILWSVANNFHLMGLASALEQRISQKQVRAMMDTCEHKRVGSPSRFDLSRAGNSVWILDHWQIVLR